MYQWIYSPILCVVFLFCQWFLLFYKNFLIWWCPICLFLLLHPMFEEIYLIRYFYKLYVISWFSLRAFKILSLSLKFVIWIMMCLGIGLFGLTLIGTFCASWNCVAFPLSTFRKFSVFMFSNRVSIPCFFSSSSGIAIIQMFVCFMLCCGSLKLSSHFLVFFLCNCSTLVFLSTLSSSSLIQTSVSPRLLIIPSSIIFFSIIVFYISSCFLFTVSNSSFMLLYLPLSSL